MRSHCINIFWLISNAQSQAWSVLTEHALKPHKTADVAVKVNVEVFICIAHGYDVIQLFVEVKPLVWRR